VLVRYLLPGRCRKLLVDLLDPDAGPPPAARPVSLELARGYAEALSARDWPAVEAFLGDGFTMIDPRGRRYGARTYRRSLRVMATAYPDLTIWLEGAVAEDGAPEVAWVRFGERGTPRRGPVLDATWWERWTLDPAAARLREMELAGVVRVA